MKSTKGKIDAGFVIDGREHLFEIAWDIGDREEIGFGCEDSDLGAVEVKFGGRTITRNDDPELVWPHEENLGAGII
jgi:hypothetical protein